MIFCVAFIFIFNIIATCRCSDINPELKPLLDKLKVDEKYHRFANDMYNEADKTLTEENSPLKHIQTLNLSVRMLLNSVPDQIKLLGTEAETMGKKILQYAKKEFTKHDIAETLLKSRYNMSDDDIVKFKKIYEDTKQCVEKLNVLFECV